MNNRTHWLSRWHSRLALLALFSMQQGCAPQESLGPIYSDSDLSIIPVPRDSLCQGSVDVIILEYDRIAEIHTKDDERPEQRLVVQIGEQASKTLCNSSDDSVAGCVGRTEDGVLTAVGDLNSMSHELVHGVRRQYGHRGNRFLEEGLAQFYQAGHIRNYGVARTPVDIDQELESFTSYIGAMMFVAFLSDRYTEESFVAATLEPEYASASSRAELDVWFESSFAETLPEVIEAFESTDPPILLNRAGPCSLAIEPTPTSPSTTEITCDDNAMGITESGLHTRRIQSKPVCFAGPDAAANVVHLSSEDVTISVVSWFCVDGEPQTKMASVLRAGEQAPIPEDACRFSVASSGPVDGYSLRWSLE